MPGGAYAPRPAAPGFTPVTQVPGESQPTTWDQFANAVLHIPVIGRALHTVGAITEADRRLYGNIVAPITASILSVTPNENTYGRWNQNVGLARQVSPGQAVYGLVAGAFGESAGNIGLLDPTRGANAQTPVNPQFNITDPAQRQQAFSQDWVGRWASGSTDAAFNWYLDPLVIGGKGVSLANKAYRTAEVTTEKAAQKVTEQVAAHGAYLAGQEGGRITARGQWLADIVERNRAIDVSDKAAAESGYAARQAALLKDPVIAHSTDPVGMASLFSRADTYDDAATILRAGLGDSTAMARLRVEAYDIADEITRMRGEIQEQVARVHNITRYDPATGKVALEWEQSNEQLQHYKQVYEAMKNRDSWLQKALNQQKSGVSTVEGQLRTFTPSQVNWVNELRRARAEMQARRTSGYWDVKFFSSGPNGMAVKVLNWMGSEVPHGHVDLTGAPGSTAWREILATLQEARSSPETINKWMERWGRAVSPREREMVLTDMELDLARQVGARHGMTVKQAEAVYRETARHRSTARDYLRQGFIVDSDGSLATTPALTVQSGGTSVPVMDFRALEIALTRHQGGFHANWGRGADGLLEMAGLFNQVWKPLVLLRLGYTVRNVGESTLAAFVKTGQFVANPFEGVYNVTANTVNRMRNLAHRGSTQRYLTMLEGETAYAESARKQMTDLIAEQEALLAGKPVKVGTADIEALSTEPTQRILGARQVQTYANLRRAADEGTITIDQAAQLRALHASAARKHLTALRREMGGRNVAIAYRDPETGRLVRVSNVKEIPDDVWLPVAENEQTAQRVAQATQQLGPGYGSMAYGEPLGERAASEVYLVKPLGNGMDVTYPVGRRVEAMASAEVEPGVGPLLDYGTLGTDNLAALREVAAWYDTHAQTLRQEMTDVADGLVKRGRNGERLSAPALLHKGGETPQTYRGFTYAGPFDTEYRKLLESDISMGLSNENILTTMDAGKWALRTERGRMRRTENWVRYNPGDKGYFGFLTEFSDMARADPVARRLLAGEDPEEVLNWLQTSAAGRNLVNRSLARPKDQVGEYVYWLKGRLDAYFPDETLRARIAAGKVTEKEVVARLGGRTDLSTIHGQELVSLKKQEGLLAVNAYNRFIAKAFDVLGTIPEDVASRFPMYRAVYNQEMRAQIDIHLSELVGASQEEAAARLADFGAIARHRAVKTVKDVMYTVDRRTRPADSLRYVMPFFQVTQNRLAYYGSQMIENPHNIARLFLGWNAIGHTTNTFGEPVVTVSLPAPVAKMLHLEPDTTLSFNRQSLNLMFQGEPWWSPGWGPPVTIPTAYLVREQEPHIPSWAQPLIRNILPTGAGQSGWDQVLPTVMRRFMVAWRKDADPQWANTYALISAHQWYLYNNGLRDTEPTPAELKRMTSDLWTFRTLAAMTLPAQPTVVSPLQPMIDKYREYQATYQGNADAMFLQDFPEVFDYVVSLSRNPTGIQPTQQANRYAEQYSDLLGTLKNPAMTSLVTNNPEDQGFDTAAYQWQKGRPIAPGSATQFRSQISPDEALAQRAVKRGWLEYTKAKQVIDSFVAQAGAKSLSDSRVAGVRAVWNVYLDRLKQNNPDWAYEYMQQDSAYYARNAADLDRIVFNDSFAKERAPSEPWVNLARRYLNVRHTLAQVLRERKLSGGAGDVGANANRDVKAVWDVVRQQLADADPTWSAYYNRFFANDDLVEVE